MSNINKINKSLTESGLLNTCTDIDSLEKSFKSVIEELSKHYSSPTTTGLYDTNYTYYLYICKDTYLNNNSYLDIDSLFKFYNLVTDIFEPNSKDKAYWILNCTLVKEIVELMKLEHYLPNDNVSSFIHDSMTHIINLNNNNKTESTIVNRVNQLLLRHGLTDIRKQFTR